MQRERAVVIERRVDRAGRYHQRLSASVDQRTRSVYGRAVERIGRGGGRLISSEGCCGVVDPQLGQCVCDGEASRGYIAQIERSCTA